MSTSTQAHPRLRPLRSLALTPLLAVALALGVGAPTSGSTASPPGSTSSVTVQAQPVYTTPLRTLGLRITAAQVGKWYRWGYAGPTYFDCSGLVYYVYHKRLGRNLPRTANAQRLATIRIYKSNVLPGDLVFFMSGGRAYHVGVYAGYGKVWHAPRPGQRVQLSRIWTTSWVAGRVR